MARSRTFFAIATAVGMTMVATLGAADLKLPPIDGELSGDFTPIKLPGAPKLHWTVTLKSEGETGRAADVLLQGAGTRLHATGRIDAAENGTWRLIESEIDIGPWIAALMPAVDATLTDFKATGQARAAAHGTWSRGAFGGQAIVSLRDGRIDDPAHKLLLEGVAFDLNVGDLAARRTASHLAYALRFPSACREARRHEEEADRWATALGLGGLLGQ